MVVPIATRIPIARSGPPSHFIDSQKDVVQTRIANPKIATIAPLMAIISQNLSTTCLQEENYDHYKLHIKFAVASKV